MLTVGVGEVWGATATFSGWSYSKGITGGTLSGAPTGAAATLTTTYTAANQMTSGNSQTLTLSGFDGYAISGVTVHVRCNKSSGAGSGTLTINGSSAGSLSSQSGLGNSYTDKSFSVTSTVVRTGGTIVITLTASESSFWCDSYSVTYETPSPHTITFNAGTGTCGTASSGSVTSYTLPAASPSASCALEGWVFAGWKESSTQSSASAPASKLWQAGETYSPASDITLYAVYFKASGNTYEYIDNLNSLFDGAKMIITAYNSGDYAVSNTTDGDGYIYSSSVSPDGDEVISSPANSIVWTLKGYKDNWTLKNVGNNKYIIVSTRPALADVSETFSITYEVDEDDYGQFNIQKGSKYLYMWNDNTFSGYNKTYLYFYQQQGTYITNPSCCTALGSINGSFF